MSDVSLAHLRAELDKPQPHAERMLAFLNLLEHPAAEWNDVLDALSFEEPTCGWAALKLHALFDHTFADATDNGSAQRWRELFDERGINPATPVAAPRSR